MKLTNRQVRNRVDKEVDGFMLSARKFLATKAGYDDLTIPAEWELSMTLLEAYYRQFCELNIQISQLDTLLVENKNGFTTANPLINLRDKATIRLESLMKELGLSMKSAMRLGATDIKKEETALDKFFKNKVEKR